MLKFKTDEQTLNDLKIFPKYRKEISIFGYFDKTRTRGGSIALHKLMDSPFNAYKDIIDQVDAIKYSFRLEEEINLCLNDDKLDIIEYYLNLNTASLRDNLLDALFDKISYKLKPTNGYYLTLQALKYIQEHFNFLGLLNESFKGEKLPVFFAGLRDDVIAIQKNQDFESLFNNEKEKISFRQINHFDALLKDKYSELLKQVIKKTYLLDAYLSVGKIAQKGDFTFPKFINSEAPKFNAKQLFHPFVPKPVPCDFELGKNKNLCFLTGPNMAGKSTFLKAVALTIYLAHIGFPVPSKDCTLSVFNGLFTTINLSDDIEIGYSHYYSEVKRVKEIATQIKEQKNLLIIFDELFRGTNVKDACDAGLLVTKGFLNSKKSLFLISSHITEIGEELESEKCVDLKYFESRLDGDVPVNTYQIKEGISNERHGLAIVNREGIAEILENAI